MKTKVFNKLKTNLLETEIEILTETIDEVNERKEEIRDLKSEFKDCKNIDDLVNFYDNRGMDEDESLKMIIEELADLVRI